MSCELVVTATDRRPPLAPLLPATHILGHLSEMRRDPLALFTRARAEVGDVVRVRMGHLYVVFLYHPLDIHHVLTQNARNYAKKTRGYQLLQLLLGQGLLTSDGAHWKRQRRIAQPAFHRRVIEGFHSVFVEEAQRVVRELEPAADTGETVDMAEVFNRLTLRVAARTLFGTDVDEGEVGRSLTVVLDRFNDLAASVLPAAHRMPTPSNFRFFRAIRSLHRVVDQIIANRHREGRAGDDLLGMLMASRDAETGEAMTDVQLRDEIMTMLLAGHETTANALCWTLHLLSTHPDVGRQLRAELGGVTGGQAPTFSELPQLTYTSQVLSESMRLYPPAWILGRSAIAEDTIGGYRVPAGTFVYMSQYVTHRHPEFWPNPEGFDPERFAPEGPAHSQRTKGAYFPFSTGQRKCIGDHFARMESLTLLAVLSKAYRFSLLPGHRIESDPSVTLRPKSGLPMTLERVPSARSR